MVQAEMMPDNELATAEANRGSPAGLVLFPGSGSSAAHSALVAIEEELAPLPVGRFDFPYRKEGRHFPDRAPKLIATVVEEATEFARQHNLAARNVFLGGRSMGGRMASMAVAEGLNAAGLVLISYPLHPPRKPEKLRVEHLPGITVPTLLISGTKDPFGTPEELQAAMSLIPAPVTVHWIEGGRHELKGKDAEVATLVSQWLNNLVPG